MKVINMLSNYKIFTLFFLLLLASRADGAATGVWTQSTAAEFGKGVAQNVSVHSTGEIRLSPQTEVVSGIKGSAFVWSMTSDVQNQVYIGTGDPGTVYRIKNGSEAVELFSPSELYVQSIAADTQGNLYAGASPNGVIYKINSQGEASVFCNLPAAYIWDMAVDNNSNLFAATGSEGVLFKVSPDGVPSVFFDSLETNLLDIAIDQHNNIYAGTEPSGLVYKIAPSGQPQVLYDAGEGEIHTLAVNSQGDIYAGTASGAPPQVPAAPATQQVVQTGVVSPFSKDEKAWDLNIPEEIPMAQTAPVSQQRSPSRENEAMPRTMGMPMAPNYVYKITKEGLARRIFEAGQAFILGVSLDTQDNLYVVTGNKPGVYKVSKNETSSSLMEMDEAQALCCLNTGNNELYVGTGNAGKVYKINPSFAKEGVFVSNVLDTTTVSSWGCIYWEDTQPEGTDVALATRSGNGEKPDHTWSDWSPSYQSSGERIASPSARFIQYKAHLQTTNGDSTPVVNKVSLSYLPKNQPPKIVSFAVEKEPAVSAQKPADAKADGKAEAKPQTPSLAKPHHQIAQKNIQWEVEDPNNDSLQLTVYFKGVDEKAWKMVEKSTQKKGSYAWDTLRLPDGKYQIKLTASDEPDNPPETALSAENIIQPMVIDNSRPIIRSLSTASGTEGRHIVSGAVKDEHSNIIKVQYTIDGHEWISAYPVDGVFDSQEESFQITTKRLAPGDYTLIVNAFDSEGNIGVEKVMFEAR